MCWASQRAGPNAYRLMHSPSPRACRRSVLAQQSGRRMHRCLRGPRLRWWRALGGGCSWPPGGCAVSLGRASAPPPAVAHRGRPTGARRVGRCTQPASCRRPHPAAPLAPWGAQERAPASAAALAARPAAPRPRHRRRPPAGSRPLGGTPAGPHGRRHRGPRRPFLGRAWLPVAGRPGRPRAAARRPRACLALATRGGRTAAAGPAAGSATRPGPPCHTGSGQRSRGVPGRGGPWRMPWVPGPLGPGTTWRSLASRAAVGGLLWRSDTPRAEQTNTSETSSFF